MPENQATVRMFRQGLGDCLLLSFPGKGREFHILIDCGALPSKHYDSELMKRVVTKIHDLTGGHLDVVAVTHEHWDHVSGFRDARDVFETFTIGAVWVPWTEDPGDEAAQQLKQEFGKELAALKVALERVRDGVHREAICGIFDFYGGLAAAGAGRTSEAWQYILKKGKNVFCSPDRAPMELPEVEGVRVYVCGPPKDPSYIRKCLSPKETYDGKEAVSAYFDGVMDGAGIADGPEARESRPFDSRFAVEMGDATTIPFFKEHYGFERSGGEEWRRIDNDWFTAAGELALYLDSYTNNTSLVLAFELGSSGKVLLFPGDAQVGNWLSWSELEWQVRDSGVKRKVTVDDLLRRTVLYKVGHHGSHNATLRAKGLEKMVDHDLVAMIPVHRKTAKDKHWKFPFAPLLARLEEKAGGRVVTSDVDTFDFTDLPEGKEQFEQDLKITELYLEYKISY